MMNLYNKGYRKRAFALSLPFGKGENFCNCDDPYETAFFKYFVLQI